MAQALANRVNGPEAVEIAYTLAFQRRPTAVESGAAHALIAKHGLAAFCRALLNSNELLYLE